MSSRIRSPLPISHERLRFSDERAWLSCPTQSFFSRSAFHVEERQFLHWCGAELFKGRGRIVDLYSPLAEAGIYLAAGVAVNTTGPRRSAAVNIVNSFEVTQDLIPLIEGGASRRGGDFLPHVESIWGLYKDFITPRRDLALSGWGAVPIEILYCGSLTSWENLSRATTDFFRNLIPGKGVVILRDYVYCQAYWLHIFMEFYSNHFCFVANHIPRTSAAWLLIEPLPASACSVPLEQTLTVDQMLALIDVSIARFEAPYSTLIAIAKGHLIADAFGPLEAAKFVEGLRETVDDGQRALPHIERFAAWTDRELRKKSRSTRPFMSRKT